MKKLIINSVHTIFLTSALFLTWGAQILAQNNNVYAPLPLQSSTNNNVGIHYNDPNKPLHIHGYAGYSSCYDPTIKLSVGQPMEAGYLSLLSGTVTPNNLNLYTVIQNRSVGDLVLSVDNIAEDLILTTRNYLGCVRFATTEEEDGNDIERMTITPEGRVGISYVEPENLFSVKTTTGMDFWNDNINFQDIRFNCYANDEYDGDSPSDTSSGDNYGQSYHHNILGGHAAIIQSKSSSVQGGLLLCVSQNYANPDSRVEFFEYNGVFPVLPMGILIQNYQTHTNIGLASLTEENTRVKIQGRTADNTMNAFKIINWDEEPLFTVRNDGYISIGSSTYTEALPDDINYRLSVDGQIVAKDVIVTLEDWSDYVLEENYNLQSIEELEKYIKENKHLPDIPSASEVEQNGIHIGEMQVLLLKKVEELTLYVIQLKKENDDLKSRINKLENKK